MQLNEKLFRDFLLKNTIGSSSWQKAKKLQIKIVTGTSNLHNIFQLSRSHSEALLRYQLLKCGSIYVYHHGTLTLSEWHHKEKLCLWYSLCYVPASMIINTFFMTKFAPWRVMFFSSSGDMLLQKYK
jgi:hypothetical protein